MNLKEITENLAAKGKVISQIYTEAGEDLDFSKVKCLEGDTTAKVDALRALDKEVTDLSTQRKNLLEIEASLKRGQALNEEMNKPAQIMTFPGKSDPKTEVKSVGQLFMESKAYTNKGQGAFVDVDTKTLFQTSAGWDPEATRISRVELYPTRRLSVIDYIPQLNTDKDTIKYMKESTFTNNAAEAAAGGTYGEAALVYIETSDEVEKIGVWLPVTDEQLEDVASMAGFLNSRLSYMLKAKLDAQVLVGSGAPPALLGTVNLGSLNAQAKGTDSVPDAIYKAMTYVRATGFAEPSVVYMNPNDWQSVRLLTTADGIYIFGSPMTADPEIIWGVPVCNTTAETENTAIVGDYRAYSTLYWRRGIQFKITESHDDFFIKGKQAIRADVRCSMVHYRVDAFSSVTGI